VRLASLALLLGLSGCGAVTVPVLSAVAGFGASAFKLDLAVLQWWESQRAEPVPTLVAPLPAPTIEKATP